MTRPSAMVIGGSLSGLFTANLLRISGWHVEVFERARGDLSGRGAGLGAQSELFSVMRRVGIPIEASIWAEVHSHICLDRTGEMLCQVPVREATTAWDRVYRALRHAFPTEFYRGGMTLARCEQDEHGVTAVFADGSRATADLLIGADGMRSTVRRQLMPEYRAMPATLPGGEFWRKVRSRQTGAARRSITWCSACRTGSWRSPCRWRLRTMCDGFAVACSYGSGRPTTARRYGTGAPMRRDIAMAIRFRRL
jgi:2-polyprenyl-6-methoxyphenol hydroxylase-like FAD-dependent oxidoreductase